MYTDPEGKFGVVFWTCVVLGVGIGMIGGYSIGRSNGLTGWDLFGATIGGGIVGGLLGAAGGYFIEAFLLGGVASGLSIGALSGGGFGLALSNGYTIATATVQTLSIATAGVIGIESLMFFAKGSGPRMGHNQYENKQFKEAMKRLRIKRSDPRWRKAHDALDGTAETLKELIEAIKEILGL